LRIKWRVTCLPSAARLAWVFRVILRDMISLLIGCE
jgi:hypothetical protein